MVSAKVVHVKVYDFGMENAKAHVIDVTGMENVKMAHEIDMANVTLGLAVVDYALAKEVAWNLHHSFYSLLVLSLPSSP